MDANQKKSYKSIILINEMLVKQRQFKITFNGDDAMLEPYFVELLAKNYLAVEGGLYKVTKAGEEVFNTFVSRYKEYLRVYDIYSCVDIANGQFAFEHIFDFDEEQWNTYKNESRFYDVRIAVSNFKKINPHEIVFMSFINENRFDTSSTGWQFDLLADNVWDEIDKIVNTAITIDDLGGIEVMENIVGQGNELMRTLINKEIEIKKKDLEEAKSRASAAAVNSNSSSEEEEYIVETTTVIEEYEDDLVYYDPYFYDPYYYSPIWVVPLFLW